MKSVNFVCTGNICRSAMAATYMQKKLYDINKQNEIVVNSCGTSAYDGDKITDFAIKAIGEYGVDASYHRATNIYNSTILNDDVILCMTSSHKKRVLEIYPKLDGKVYTLKEYVGIEDVYQDIDDPWGYGIEIYKDCAKDIVKCVDKLLEML